MGIKKAERRDDRTVARSAVEEAAARHRAVADKARADGHPAKAREHQMAASALDAVMRASRGALQPELRPHGFIDFPAVLREARGTHPLPELLDALADDVDEQLRALSAPNNSAESAAFVLARAEKLGAIKRAILRAAKVSRREL